ncbi:LLM class flavin-dependent oxidoreductase [Kitasatospora viridis]|uniref:Alkanesulfonate monooxygenase n=1 Tax=Kitasatospora viridis TaxID=281105 RepID=A0A561UAC5_9ACTN|nr:LLM class flavin-dependent oxidoreductase [Kitasatospora viridis]TWF96311.1 alkanesulfonate monooxygenase [Kitasatospora viridis]
MRRPTFHWFLPTHGDSRDIVGGGHASAVGTAARDRPASPAYLRLIASAAEQLGFAGALTPTGAWADDAWLATAALAPVTQRLKYIVAFRPGLASPLLVAQQAATFQKFSGGRLLLNVVVGGESREQRAYGDYLDKEQRYARADEFLGVVRGLWRGDTVDFEGQHVRLSRARLADTPDPTPAIYFGGSSEAAGPVAARHADVYLTWGEPPAAVAEKIEWIRGLAAAEGREIRFGIRFHVITRNTAQDAWAQAERLLSGIDPRVQRSVLTGLRRSESEGQRRMVALHNGARDNLEVYPNLWAGFGLVRRGAGTALVGSHEEVADRIAEYHALGIDEFILSGFPHLEEAYWFGEGVLPVLTGRGLWAGATADGAAPVQ